MSEAPKLTSSPKTGGYGLCGEVGSWFLFGTRLDRPLSLRSIKVACGVAVARGGARRACARGRRTVRCCRRGVAEDS